MASDGAQRKPQRRFLLVLNIFLCLLGLRIWLYDFALMSDALFVADQRFGWILWLSFSVACSSIALGFIGCWGIMRSNNWLYVYFCFVLLSLTIMTVLIRIGATEVRKQHDRM